MSATRWQAESRYIVAAGALAAGAVWASFLIVTLLGPSASIVPVASIAVVTLVVTCAGYQPAVRVRLERGELRIRQGGRRLDLERSAVESWEIISRERFHTDLRRRPDTTIFVNRLAGAPVRLHLSTGTLVIGLPERERHRFTSALDAVPTTSLSASS